MAINDFDTLKAAVGTWMLRSDMAGNAEDFISLAEAALNREIGPVETNVVLTGSEGSRSVDISTLPMVEPIALFLAETGYDELELTQKAAGTFPYLDSAGRPNIWAIDGSTIVFDRTLDQPYPLRFRYRQRFALSDASTTNWLLTNHPDVYLAAALVWGGVFIQDDPSAARWIAILNSGLPSVRSTIAQSKRSVSGVDPALLRPGYWNGRTMI